MKLAGDVLAALFLWWALYHLSELAALLDRMVAP